MNPYIAYNNTNFDPLNRNQSLGIIKVDKNICTITNVESSEVEFRANLSEIALHGNAFGRFGGRGGRTDYYYDRSSFWLTTSDQDIVAHFIDPVDLIKDSKGKITGYKKPDLFKDDIRNLSKKNKISQNYLFEFWDPYASELRSFSVTPIYLANRIIWSVWAIGLLVVILIILIQNRGY